MKNLSLINLALLTATAILATGCATIVDGGDKSVRFNSNPSGATVIISDKTGKEVCIQTTPAMVNLRRSHGVLNEERYKITFELPGYYPANAKVVSIMNGWYLGNIILGGVIGMLVDIGTSAAFTLSPRDVFVNLVAVDPSLTPEQVTAAQIQANPKKRPKPMPVPAGKGDGK